MYLFLLFMEDKIEETHIQRAIREDLERQKNQETSFAQPPDVGIEKEKYEPINSALSDYLGVKSDDWDTYKDKLSVIREWAEVTSRSKDRVEILAAIKYLENKIAPPLLAENRVKNLYKYIRLDMDQKRIEKEKELYEK